MSDQQRANSRARPISATPAFETPSPLHLAIDTLSAVLIHAQGLDRVLTEGSVVTATERESLQQIVTHLQTLGDLLTALHRPDAI